MVKEVIKTIWKIGYFKVFDENGFLDTEPYISTQEGEWKKVCWRFYWRVS